MNKQILIIEDDEDIADQIIQQRLNQANVSNHMQVLGALLDREVRIDVGTDDMQVLISVIDSGPGVPEPQRARIFEHFYRADNASRSGEHAGLGLAIVKKIIEMHRQQIRVDSPLGGGAAFAFTLQSGDAI